MRQCETVSDTPLTAAILGRCSTLFFLPCHSALVVVVVVIVVAAAAVVVVVVVAAVAAVVVVVVVLVVVVVVAVVVVVVARIGAVPCWLCLAMPPPFHVGTCTPAASIHVITFAVLSLNQSAS